MEGVKGNYIALWIEFCLLVQIVAVMPLFGIKVWLVIVQAIIGRHDEVLFVRIRLTLPKLLYVSLDGYIVNVMNPAMQQLF